MQEFHWPHFSKKPTLIGKNVTLRPFQSEDWLVMNEVINQPEIKRLTGSVTSTDAANKKQTSEEEYLTKQWYDTRNQQSNRLDLAIYANHSQEVIGEVVLNEWQESTNTCHYRMLISQDYQNQGLGTEATKLMLAYGFQELNLHRIELEVYEFNPKAKHVYETCGFLNEGTKREAFLFDKQWVDIHLMAMLESDFQSTK